MDSQPEQETKGMTKTRLTVVSAVYFTVPSGASIGPGFSGWGEAVAHARGTIERFEYRGQVIRPDAPDFHPRRCFQEGDTLVTYSRAFVQMRVTEPVQARPSGPQSGQDGVAATWEVFRDGTAEALPDHSGEQPPAAEPGVWAPTRAEITAAARQELIEGLAAELATHLDNTRDELRRYEAAVAHREHVFRLRTGQPEPGEGHPGG